MQTENRIWNICTKEHFLNQEKIFPTAQQDVLQIIKNARQYPEIKKVVVFGSAVTPAFMHWNSDLDIYVEQSTNKTYPLYKGVRLAVDYLREDLDYKDERIFKEIEEKGVTVYEK